MHWICSPRPCRSSESAAAKDKGAQGAGRDEGNQKATERVYDLFVEDPKGTVTFEVLKKVATDTGDDASDEDLRRLIKSGASNGNDIPYEEFHSIMVKDISLK